MSERRRRGEGKNKKQGEERENRSGAVRVERKHTGRSQVDGRRKGKQRTRN